MERLLNIGQLAGLLGVEVSTVYSWTHRKAIPFIKIGKLVRFRESDIMTWLEKKACTPDQPAPIKASPIKSGNSRARKAISNDYVARIVEGARKEVFNGV